MKLPLRPLALLLATLATVSIANADPSPQPPSISEIAPQTAIDGETLVVPFTVADPDGPAGDVVVDATTADATLIPPQNLQFLTFGAERLLFVTPAAHVSGTTTITIKASDGTSQSSRPVRITVVNRNDSPTLGPLPDILIDENQVAGPIPLTLADTDDPVTGLTISIDADDTALFPSSNFSVDGTGTTRSLFLTPAPNQSGSTTVRVVVTDPRGATSFQPLQITVRPINLPPELSPLTAATIAENNLFITDFEAVDPDGDPAALRIAFTSSNPTLVPTSAISIINTARGKRLRVIPAAASSGTTRISVTATDPEGASSTRSFDLTVTPRNQEPSFHFPAADFRWNSPGAEFAIPFILTDRETADADLRFVLRSSNPFAAAFAQPRIEGTGPYRTLRIATAPGQSGQSEYTIEVQDGGGATTVRKLNLTVSNGTPSPTQPDLNGDGLGDLVLQHRDGFIAASFLAGTDVAAGAFLNPNRTADGHRVIGAADFNQDGHLDLATLNSASHTLQLWTLQGVVRTQLSEPIPLGSDHVAAIGDLNGDHNPDLVVQSADGSVSVRLRTAAGGFLAATPLQPSNPGDPGWKVVGVADLDRDGSGDLLFQHTDGTLSAWLMDGLRLRSPMLLSPSHPGDAAWRLAAVTDLDGDRSTDLVFQHADGSISVWFMNGLQQTRASLLFPPSPGTEWSVVGPR